MVSTNINKQLIYLLLKKSKKIQLFLLFAVPLMSANFGLSVFHNQDSAFNKTKPLLNNQNLQPLEPIAPKIQLTEEEKQWLHKHKTVRLGVDPDWPPFEFFGEDGSYMGMASDVVDLLSKRIGLKMEVVRNLSWADVISKGKARELDVFPCVVKTPERLEYMNFTRPYLSFPVIIITQDNAPFIGSLLDLHDKKVAVVKNYFTQELLERDHPTLKLELSETTKQALEWVSMGKIDAFIGNLATASYLIKQYGFTNLKVAATTPYSFELGFAARNDWPELVNILDKGIQTITRQEYNAIYQKWIAIRYEQGIDITTIWKIALQIGTVVVLILVLMLFWNRRLVREITKRKQAEEELRKLSRAIEQSPSTIVITDLKGTIEFVNPAFTLSSGYSYEEAVGENPRILKSDRQSPELYQEMWETLSNGTVWQGELINKRKNGELYWEFATLSPLKDQSGKTTHYLAIKEDITQRKQAEESLRLEQEKSERLLLNILPKTIADQLKQNERAIAEHFEQVTILFADIVGFTPLSARLPPIKLVNLLNQLFSTFDRLAEQYNLEKIKTIGDAYMVVGGLPEPRADHAEAVATMALDMQEQINHFRSDTGEIFQIRIGINTGPVVAGVIGKRKFSYDLWGNTVNVASRMESSGKAGKIQVTTSTYECIAHNFLFEKRGMIEVKGKGKMMTYWLMGRNAAR